MSNENLSKFTKAINELLGMLDQHVDSEKAKQIKKSNENELRIMSLPHIAPHLKLDPLHLAFVQTHIDLGKLLFDANSGIPRDELWNDALAIWEGSSASISVLVYACCTGYYNTQEQINQRINFLNNAMSLLKDPKNPETTSMLVNNEMSRIPIEGSRLYRYLKELKWPIPLMHSILIAASVITFAVCVAVALTTPAAFGAAIMAAIFVPTFLLTGNLFGIRLVLGGPINTPDSNQVASKMLADRINDMAKRANPENYEQYHNSLPPIKFLGMTLKSAKSKKASNSLGTHAKLSQTIVTDASAPSATQNDDAASITNKPVDTQNSNHTSAEQDHTPSNRPK